MTLITNFKTKIPVVSLIIACIFIVTMLVSNDNRFIANNFKTGKTYLKLASCKDCQKFAKTHDLSKFVAIIELSKKSNNYKNHLKQIGITQVPARIFNVKLTNHRQITIIKTPNAFKLIK